ncbi:MAG TPA: zinc finger Ran-binding domain-containing protein [Anaerolineales bacterium]|nr:zinc finger Ran-binding domain-containing protein [Anaerolineales bacterium]
MKKVLQTASKYIFAVFGIAVLALLMSLTYSALARIFPDSLINRMWGLVMFDIAAMCWALAFVFTSESTGQYASSAIGFIVAFIGTLGMVAAEVILSSGQIEAGDIGQWMTYGFIIVTALHAALLYAHEATAPDIHEKINVGIARGEIVTTAIKQATNELDQEKASLAVTIHRDIVSQVKRDLGLEEADPNMPFLPKDRTYQQTAMPILKNPYDQEQSKEPTYHPIGGWTCLGCGNSNPQHAAKCEKCGKELGETPRPFQDRPEYMA